MRWPILAAALVASGCCVPATGDEARVYAAYVDQIGLSARGTHRSANRTLFARGVDREKLAAGLGEMGVPAGAARELVGSIVLRNRVTACVPFPLPTTKKIELEPVGSRRVMDRLADLWIDGWAGPTYERVRVSFSRVGFSESGKLAVLYTGDEHNGSFWLLTAGDEGWTLDKRPVREW
jgi:hypothetical protein